MAALVLAPCTGLDIRWVRTPSIPTGIYWAKPVSREIQRGDLVCFRYLVPSWARGREYLPPGGKACKAVLGLPGDHVVRKGDVLSICRTEVDCAEVGRLVAADRQGRSLPRDIFPARSAIPPGHLYLGAFVHERSLDSRYLGFIPVSNLESMIRPALVDSDEMKRFTESIRPFLSSTVIDQE